MTCKRILIADDEPLYCQTTGELLRKAGFECVCVSNGNDAISALNDQAFDLVLSDLNMPGNFKMELLKEHSRQRPATPLIVITGVPSLPTAIESIRLGIADYLLKPVKFDDLLTSVRAAIEKSQRQRQGAIPLSADNDGSSSSETSLIGESTVMVGQSPPMLELFEVIRRVAQSDSNILITGESGTGKEEVAHAIHRLSHRVAGSFQVIDCTAIPEMLFESTLFGHKKGAFTGAVSDQAGLLSKCHEGTAFLDELGELPLTLQAKLLRAVQQQTFTPVGSDLSLAVDTRFICATNRDLQLEVREARFRQDLFYRLAVIPVHVPPLRERGEDILLLAEHFLQSLGQDRKHVTHFDSNAVKWLMQYDWPGNIRELRNVIERAIVLATGSCITAKELTGVIDGLGKSHPGQSLQDLPASENGSLSEPHDPLADGGETNLSRDEAVRIAERDYLLGLLESLKGNVSEAARQAGISRQGLHKLLRAHDIDAKQFRNERLGFVNKR
jgi:DNA-binding NtrC family response regulator